MVTSLYLCLFAQSDPLINADLRTVTLPWAVKELERQTGIPHKLAGANPDQFIYINVKGLAASRVREGIARVARGEWKVIEGAQVLVTEPWAKAIDDVYAKNVASEIESAQRPMEKPEAKEFIADYVKRVEGPSTSAQYSEAHWDWIERTPTARLLRGLVGILPIQDLTGLQHGERRVFSLNPTELQAKLPSKAESIFSNFLEENRQFTVFANGYPCLAQQPFLDIHDSGFIDPAVHGEPEHLLLTALREGVNIRFNLKLYNRNGELAAIQISFSVQFKELQSSNVLRSDSRGSIFKLVPDKEPLKLSPIELEFNQKFFEAVRAQSGKPGWNLVPDPMVTERLEALVKNDVLLNGPTEVLSQLASLTTNNLIAKVCDINFTHLAFFSRRREFNLPSLLQSIYNPSQKNEDETLKVESDLITLRHNPVNIGYAKGYFDRPAALALIRQARKGGIGHSEYAVMCAAHETYEDSILPQSFRGIYSSTGGILLNEDHYELLKFFGLLAQEARQASARSEISIPWQSLVGAQLNQARRLVLWSEKSLSGRQGLSSEPTHGLAAANMAQAAVKVSLKKSPQWYLKSESLRTPLQAAPPAMVRGLLSPELIKAGQGIEKYDFLLGAEEVLDVTFDFGQHGKISHRLARIELSPDSKAMKYSDLPDDFKKAVQNAVIKPEGGG